MEKKYIKFYKTFHKKKTAKKWHGPSVPSYYPHTNIFNL